MIRPLAPDDFPALADLLNMVNTNPVPITVEGLQRTYHRRDSNFFVRRFVAEENGALAGYTSVLHEPWMPEGYFSAYVLTHPDHRRQGIGAALYDTALAVVRANAGTTINADIPEQEQAGLRFAQQRGFAIDRHTFYSRLEVATFDEDPFEGIIEAVEAQGIRFFTMADLPDTEEYQRRLYDLYRATASDIPGATGQRPFEDFQKMILGSAWYRRDAQLIAAEGNEWVGLATLRYTPATASVYLQMTGVTRPYRGRKIATALKLLGIQWAKQIGATLITTSNDSLNDPILAINRKMGFVPQPGRYQLVKDIPRDA